MLSFRVAHSRTLFILKNFVSIVSFLPFLKKTFFYGSSFTMSASTANIAKKKATTLPTTLDDASISIFVLEQAFEKGRQYNDEDLRCFKNVVTSARSKCN
jgi:hypothetical protein